MAVEYGYDNGADDVGNRTSVSDGVNPAAQYAYNSMGCVTSVTDANGNPPTTLTYEPNGVDLKQISNGLGNITLSYNSAHDVMSITDRLGHVTEFDYSADGQLLWQKEYLNGTPIVTEYVYNAQQQVERVRRDGQDIASFTYDAIGRVLTATDATRQTLTYAYNNLNHVTSVTYPDGKSVSYAYSGCCPRLMDSVTDRAGQTTYYTYDDLKNLVEVLAPGSALTTYGYDPNGNLLSFTDSENHTTSFVYDLNNRLTRKTYHDGKYVEWTYNAVGLVNTYTSARNTVTTYTYDANGNLESISYSDSTPNVGYTYDAYDRLDTMTDGIGAWDFGYDANSQLTSVDGPWANDTITYVPDDLGRISQMQPQGGTAVSYMYDTLNRLTQVQRGAENFVYTYTGVNPLVQQLTRPNGSVTEYQYNALSQLTDILNTTSTDDVLSQHTFTYNGQDLRDSEIFDGSAIPPAPAASDSNTTYNTNEVNQLLSTVAPNQIFVYDDDGNMTQGYTKDGYMFTATYDAENRMTSVQYTDSSSVLHRTEYAYSGDDLLAIERRYENSTLVDETRIVRDGMLAIQDRNAGNSVVNEYTWGLNLGGGIGGLLNLNSAGQNYAYLYDGKGNVEAILDNTESVVATYLYDPFGVLLNQTGSLNQSYGFSTKRYNAEVGMVQYEYRNYVPEVGRWLTRDPLGEAGGMNLYAFVGNNPVNWVDPWGLFNWKKLPNTSFVINPTGESILVSGNDPGSGRQQQWLMPPYSVSFLLDTPFENNDIDAVYYGDQVIKLWGPLGAWIHLPTWLRPNNYRGLMGSVLRFPNPIFDPQGAENKFKGPISPPKQECK